MTYDSGRLYTSYELTESPETGKDIPVVISWWHHSDPGDPMYVLLAAPQPERPGFAQLNALVDAEPDAVGMARFELSADDDARHTYGPELADRVLAEEDASLRRGLMLTFGIPDPSGPVLRRD